MANVGKFDEPLGSAGGIIDSPGLGESGAEVVRPVQEEHRAIQRARIFDRIVGKSVESELPPAPEDHQFGVGERRYAHCPEPVADGAQHGVKYGFQDDGVGPDIQGVDGAQDGGGTHALAVENHRGTGQVFPGESHRGCNILRLTVPERGMAFRRAARTAEIHQQDGGAHGVDLLGFAQQADFFGGVAMEEDHQRRGDATVGMPGRQRDAAGNRDGQRTGFGRERGRRALIHRPRHVDAQQQHAKLGTG